jgi:hypothetical protein
MSNGQPEKKSNLWKWLGGGCLLIVLIGACIAGSCALCAGGIYQATDAPAQAAHAFFGDVRAQNWPAAHSRMSGTYQATHTPETLQMAASAIPALTQQTDSTFSSRNVDMAGASLEGTLTTPSGSVPVSVRMSTANNAWYVESVTVQGVPLQ